MKVYYTSFHSIIGKMNIAFSHKGVVRLSFPNEKKEDFLKSLSKSFKDLVETKEKFINCEKDIDKYLKGELKEFQIPIVFKGSKFQTEVWKELMKIPYGEIRTYKDISTSIGRDKAYRAVGQACNKNPISIIIPCHRVIGSNGKLTGFGGGIELKKKLLEMEKRNT